jgi:hypothetical protein
LIGSTLPVNHTATISSGGDTSQTTDNSVDNGRTATLTIDSAMTLSLASQYAGEGTEDPTSFELSQPVTFVAILQQSITGALTGESPFLSLENDLALPVFSIGGTAQTGTWEATGTLNAGTLYFLQEGSNVDNTYPGDSSSGSATCDISLTFTAIPEPSSAALITLGGIGVLSRRRRRSLASLT